MEIEFTGRQTKISKTTREAAQEGIERVARILGPLTAASCILREERHLQVVEIHLQSRRHPLVAQGSATTQAAALRLALEHAESQSLRFRDRLRSQKRKPEASLTAEARVGVVASATGKKRSRGVATETSATRSSARKATSLAVIPTGRRSVTEPHLISAADAILPDPVTVEQAVKRAESDDRDLLIFRSPEGTQFVLHRRRDGQMSMVALG